MRLGILEIVIILIVIILILVVTRIVRAGRQTTERSNATGEMPFGVKTPGKVLQRLRVLGIIFIITGLVSLLAGVSLFKWVYWSFLWSFIAIAVGSAMILMSKKK